MHTLGNQLFLKTILLKQSKSWFIAAVLPLDGKLEAALLHRAELKRCTECGGQFLPKSNRGKYCPDCAGRMKRTRAAQRKRKQRGKCHALENTEPP